MRQHALVVASIVLSIVTTNHDNNKGVVDTGCCNRTNITLINASDRLCLCLFDTTKKDRGNSGLDESLSIQRLFVEALRNKQQRQGHFIEYEKPCWESKW